MAEKKSATIVSMDMEYTDYQTQSDMRCLAQAQLVKNDPKRYKAALKMAKDQIEALESIDPSLEDEAPGTKDDAGDE